MPHDRRRRTCTSLLIVAVTAATALVATAPPAAATGSPYPASLPDFTHAERPHFRDYGPRTGLTHRPMVVAYVTYDDAPAPAGKDTAWARSTFFGAGRSVAGYFAGASRGASTFTPVAETEGTADDGVVMVNMGATGDNEARRTAGMSDQDYYDAIVASEQTRNGLVLAALDQYVDFARYDDDHDGRLDTTELVVTKIDTWPSLAHTGTGQHFCGATRGVTLPDRLDGVALDTLQVAAGGTKQNRLTWAHEVMHAGYGMERDWYSWQDFYGFDIASETCSETEEYDWTMSAWHRMHLGWLKPTVVTRDGYYDVPRLDTSGQAFLMYDPQKGTDDYLLVENRRAGGEGYDRGVGFGRSGLAVWRYDEKQYGNRGGVGSPLKLTHPCEGTGCPLDAGFALWDPTVLDYEDRRTVQVPWADGTASRVALRAVGPSGDRQRAFFDVPGPGALVDCFDPRTSSSAVEVRPVPTRGAEVTVTVRNTGDTTDTFEVSALLPPGWSGSSSRLTLPPQTDVPATLRIVPGADAEYRQEAVPIRVQSVTDASAGSECAVQVTPTRVVPALTLEAADRLVLDAAGFRLTVHDRETLAPVAGVPTSFVVRDDAGRAVLVESTATGSDGVAVARTPLRLPAGRYTVAAETSQHGAYWASYVGGAFTLSRRPVTVAWTGQTGGDYTDDAGLSAAVTDTTTGAAIAGQHVALGVGSQRVDARTDAAGGAAAPLQLSQAAGDYTASAATSGSEVYLPASVTSPYRVTKEGVTMQSTGDTYATTAGAVLVRAAVQQSRDGSELPLDGTPIAFNLTGLLGGSSSADALVDAAGEAERALSGVPADVYALDTAVPAGDPYWQGRGKPAELVVVDTDRQLSGGGKALDLSGLPFTLQAALGYHGATPVGRLSARGGFGRFTSSAPEWLAAVRDAVGDDQDAAIASVRGTWDGAPAVARLHVVRGATTTVALVLTGTDRSWSSGRTALTGEYRVG